MLLIENVLERARGELLVLLSVRFCRRDTDMVLESGCDLGFGPLNMKVPGDKNSRLVTELYKDLELVPQRGPDDADLFGMSVAGEVRVGLKSEVMILWSACRGFDGELDSARRPR